MRRIVKAGVVVALSLSLAACNNEEGSSSSKLTASSGLANLWAKFTSADSAKDSFVADNTYTFGFDKYSLTDDAKASLDKHADYLLSHPEAKAIVEGHTDSYGAKNYNVALGERRAKAVANYLKLKGVSNDQVAIVSYGAERLVIEADSKDANLQNRRSVIKYDVSGSVA